MHIVISPAKKLYTTPAPKHIPHTLPQFLPKSQLLIDVLVEKDRYDVATLMKLSMKLADLNVLRFEQWHTPFDKMNANQAIFSFAGDVYQGLDVASLSDDDLNFSQQHLRILSGLYGMLKPLDLMQAYRLEMGTKLQTTAGKNLYEFWGSAITDQLNTELNNTDTLINLASNEYFKCIQNKNIRCNIVTPVFKEHKAGTYKVIGIHAKRARGLMARYIIQHKLHDIEAIKSFDAAGYAWNASLSDQYSWVFTRG